MSHRIEQADPLTLLRELPSRWAQTCVTSPRVDEPVAYLLAVLDEVHRVLREDGTLWLALTRCGNTRELTRALKDSRWLAPNTPHGTPRQLLLLTKSERFLFNPRRAAVLTHSLQAPGRPRSPVAPPHHSCTAARLPRRAWCMPSPGTARVLPREVIEWCVLTSTTPVSCGACGAPWTRSGRRWRPTCRHDNDRGRCLVLDPLCTTPDTSIVAARRGRAFLGVERHRRRDHPRGQRR
jgi:hypothetical protein